MTKWAKNNAIPLALVAMITLLVLYAFAQFLIKKYWKKPPKTMKTSSSGLDLIKGHEELRLVTYDDKQPHVVLGPTSPIIGTLTIGYGHTGVSAFIGNTITKETALQLLQTDLADAEAIVKARAKVNLSQNQFDALVSFAFNTGGSSQTVWEMVNNGTDEKTFKAWFNTHYITSDGLLMGGLVRRRQEESNLYWN